VIDPTDAIPDAPVPESGAGEWFRLAEETADEYGVAVETEHPVGSTARNIVEFANECDADHVVMGVTASPRSTPEETDRLNKEYSFSFCGEGATPPSSTERPEGAE